MPTRRQLIQKITLNADSSSVNFSNIPQNYTDLRIVASTRSSQSAAATNMRMTFNGSSSGYSERVLYGDSVGASSYANTSVSLFTIGLTSAATSTANTFGYIEINIPNYTSSSNKCLISKYVSENNSATQNTAYIGQLAGLWANTSSISSITFTLASGNYVANSTFYLYGITHVPIIRGGTVTVPGDGFKYHTFRSSGSLQVIEGGNIEYLVVAGGGSGGNGAGGEGGGGGGAGGLRKGSKRISPSTYSVIVGGGASATLNAKGTNGTSSSIDGISSTGGGGGGHSNSGTLKNGENGGSGGGSSANSSSSGTAGSGISGEGNSGGIGNASSPNYGGGGGGGSSAAGNNGSTTTGGAGGAGINFAGIFYAGGGGGGTYNGGTPGIGGVGGGGAGGAASNAANSGIQNTGGGGGGASYAISGTGGSGIVIIRYPYDGN